MIKPVESTGFFICWSETKDMIKRELKYQTVELTPKENQSFDLEDWLADLLVDYWLSGGGSNKGDEINER